MRQLKITKSITNRESNSLDRYLQEIGKEDLIDVEREVQLVQQIKKGNNAALGELVKANLRFVVSVAKQYQNQGVSLPDLINEGNLGLIKAAGLFDETRGFKFISYAVWWIRQGILQAISEQSRIVRLPLNVVGSISKVKNSFNKFEQDNNRPPVAEEVSNILEMSVDKVNMALSNAQKHLSMDAPFPSNDTEGANNLLEVLEGDLSTDKSLHLESLRREIERALGILTGRESGIISLFFGLDGDALSLEEIGERYALTRERVRQIKEKAIRRLKHNSRSHLLRTYLG